MSFVNLQFWLLFLPLCFGLYAAMPGVLSRNAVLLLASLLFYASYDLKYVLLLLYQSLMIRAIKTRSVFPVFASACP